MQLKVQSFLILTWKCKFIFLYVYPTWHSRNSKYLSVTSNARLVAIYLIKALDIRIRTVIETVQWRKASSILWIHISSNGIWYNRVTRDVMYWCLIIKDVLKNSEVGMETYKVVRSARGQSMMFDMEAVIHQG